MDVVGYRGRSRLRPQQARRHAAQAARRRPPEPRSAGAPAPSLRDGIAPAYAAAPFARAPRPLNVTAHAMSPTATPRRSPSITGITGQDGAYLAEFLLDKGYEVHGIKRRASLLQHRPHRPPLPGSARRRPALHPALRRPDRLRRNLIRIIQQVQPDEIYNLAAQSHVAVCFEEPEYTANADGIGTLRLLEAIRILGLEKKTRFYQASHLRAVRPGAGDAAEGDHAVLSAQPVRGGQALRLLDHGELPRGLRHVRLQRHPVQPRVARCAARPSSRARSRARWRASSSACRTACTSATSTRCATGATRSDYVEMQWLMLQQDAARGLRHRHRRAAQRARVRRDGGRRARHHAALRAAKAIDEIGIGRSGRAATRRSVQAGDVIVRVDPRYFRPTEVETLLGDAAQGASAKLGWTPKITLARTGARDGRERLRSGAPRQPGQAGRLPGLRLQRIGGKSCDSGRSGARAAHRGDCLRDVLEPLHPRHRRHRLVRQGVHPDGADAATRTSSGSSCTRATSSSSTRWRRSSPTRRTRRCATSSATSATRRACAARSTASTSWSTPPRSSRCRPPNTTRSSASRPTSSARRT